MMDKHKLNIGISLSGGGVRASVFHLGVLARLAEEDLLQNVKMTSTVSGGTLVMGLIYTANKNRWPTKKEFFDNCIPYVKKCLTEKNLQLNVIARTFLTPWYYYYGRAKLVSKSIKSVWGVHSLLNDIQDKPRWNINSTTIESGKSWRFIPQKRMGDHKLNYAETTSFSLSDAMCSSAAVPLLLGPLIINTKKFKWFKYVNGRKTPVKQNYKRIHIWDGGVYDNLGLEALTKYNKGIVYRPEINFLIACDASAGIDTIKNSFFRPKRLISVTMDQVRSLRTRALWNHFLINKNSGVFIKIGEELSIIDNNRKVNELSNFELSSLDKNVLTSSLINKIKRHPTTLWKMKEQRFNDLFRHGWEVANMSLLAYTNLGFKNLLFESK